jgi:NAD(P)-dependent dehydrogenase (short-subunit alcohol dehydrogenase family)
MRITAPLLKLAPNGGRVVIIGSKNVPAPGPGAAAYSASKAALTQLGRVAALEWGSAGVRVNTIHPGEIRLEPPTTTFPVCVVNQSTLPAAETLY